MIDFRKRKLPPLDDHGEPLKDDDEDGNPIVYANGMVKTTQGKWVPIEHVTMFFVEGRKVKADTPEKVYNLSDEYMSDEAAQDALDQWVLGGLE